MINSFDNEFSELISLELLHILTATTAAIRGTNDFLNYMFDDTTDVIDADGKSFARPGKSNRRWRNNYEDSTWGSMLTDDKDQLQNYDSDEAKLFRFRFRVPYKLYEILLEWTEHWIEINTNTTFDTTEIKT